MGRLLGHLVPPWMRLTIQHFTLLQRENKQVEKQQRINLNMYIYIILSTKLALIKFSM